MLMAIWSYDDVMTIWWKLTSIKCSVEGCRLRGRRRRWRSVDFRHCLLVCNQSYYQHFDQDDEDKDKDNKEDEDNEEMMIMTQSMYNIISTSIAVSLSVNDRISFSWTQFWGDFGASWWSKWDQIQVQFGEYFENKPKVCFSWKVSSNVRQKISWILYHNLLSFFEWGR